MEKTLHERFKERGSTSGTTLQDMNAKRDSERFRKKKGQKSVYPLWMKPEKEFQKECHKYLRKVGLRYLHLSEDTYMNTGGHYKGVPDLLIFKGDKSLLIELKKHDGKESQGQKTWRNGNDVHEVTVHLVRSWELFKELVDGFLKE
jgi:hypothetical protein